MPRRLKINSPRNSECSARLSDLDWNNWFSDTWLDAGVYFLFDRDCSLMYVGMSLGIQYRLTQHYWAGRRFASHGAVYVPGDLMEAVEVAYIHALKPSLNKKYDRPRYATHDQMVEAITKRWAPNYWTTAEAAARGYV